MQEWGVSTIRGGPWAWQLQAAGPSSVCVSPCGRAVDSSCGLHPILGAPAAAACHGRYAPQLVSSCWSSHPRHHGMVACTHVGLCASCG